MCDKCERIYTTIKTPMAANANPLPQGTEWCVAQSGSTIAELIAAVEGCMIVGAAGLRSKLRWLESKYRPDYRVGIRLTGAPLNIRDLARLRLLT